jgi:hypothetical protein
LTCFVSIGSSQWSHIKTLVLFFPHIISVWNESPKSGYTALLVFLLLEFLFVLHLVCQLENVSCLLHVCIPCDHTHFATQWFVISTEHLSRAFQAWFMMSEKKSLWHPLFQLRAAELRKESHPRKSC